MTIYEALTLAGLIVGPLSAVLITLWSQAREAIRTRQMQTFRMLVSTRHLVADPSYSVAINMIPFDFNRESRIMSLWNRYMDAVYTKPSSENAAQHSQTMQDLQTKIVFEIAKYMKYDVSEMDIQRRSYAAQSFIDRDQLNIQAQVAWIRIANALEQQNIAAGLPAAQPAEQLIPEQPVPNNEVGN